MTAHLMILFCITGLLAACERPGADATVWHDAPPPATAVTTAPSAPATSPAGANPASNQTTPSLQPDVDRLLTALEESAADLTAFAAGITYEKEDAILGRKELRTGEILYRVEDEHRSFAILFNSRIISGRRENRLHHYIFDGRWLAEIDHENKQFIKREIVEPGRQLNPLKLGEGPFPLPIGQSKNEVLARFDVARVDVPKDGMLKDLKDVDGLRLTPRPGAIREDGFSQVDIYYDRATLLPVGINAFEANDDRKTVRLSNLRRNPALDEDEQKKLDITEPDPKQWRIDIRPWRAE